MWEFCSLFNPRSELFPLTFAESFVLCRYHSTLTSTSSTTQRQSINTPTAKPDTCSQSTPAPGGTLQTDSMGHIVSIPAFGIANTPTALSGVYYLPTTIADPAAWTILTHPLRTWAAKCNRRQRQWQLQLQWVVPSRCTIPRFGHSDMTPLAFAMGNVLQLSMKSSLQFMSANDLEMVSYATWHIAQVLAEAPHWRLIEQYGNTTMQRSNIWSIAFEARTKEILKAVYWSNGAHWIWHAQTGTKFKHKLIGSHDIIFNQQRTT